jgi:hypothetical protein
MSEAAERCGIQPTEIWSAHWNGQLCIIVLGPRTNRVLLSELDRWWRTVQTSVTTIPADLTFQTDVQLYQGQSTA